MTMYSHVEPKPEIANETQANRDTSAVYMESLHVLAEIEGDIAALLRHVEDVLRYISEGCTEEPASARLAMTTLGKVERGILNEIAKLSKKRPNRLSVYSEKTKLTHSANSTRLAMHSIDMMLEKLK